MQSASLQGGQQPCQAKLSFAHAETLIPLACLLGLFDPQGRVWPHTSQASAFSDSQTGISHGSPAEVDRGGQLTCSVTDQSTFSPSVAGKAVSGESLSQCHPALNMPSSRQGSGSASIAGGDQAVAPSSGWQPPFDAPPASRDWYGSMVAPYSANMQFVLYNSSACNALEVGPSTVAIAACPILRLLDSSSSSSSTCLAEIRFQLGTYRRTQLPPGSSIAGLCNNMHVNWFPGLLSTTSCSMIAIVVANALSSDCYAEVYTA